jgi:ribosomal protein L11 methyltransferase
MRWQPFDAITPTLDANIPPMTTFTALTTLADEASATGLGAALERLEPEPTGVGVFEMEDGSGLWEVGGYFLDRPDDVQLTLLATAFGAAPFAVSDVPETDWVAHVRRELAPVEAGRFFLYGGHDADQVPEGRIALRIEAAMAFGTGHHGTTLGCLRAMEGLANQGVAPRRIADVGCGTAVLAMAAARLWEVEVLASDIDAVAIDVARENLAANELTSQVHLIEAAGFDHPDLRAGGFDLIVANILKGPLIDVAPALSEASAAGGWVILSGILHNQAQEVAAVYTRHGFNEVAREMIVDWTTLVLEKSR